MVERSQVLEHAARHGVAAASARFGVNDRTIRKWRAKAAAPADNQRLSVGSSGSTSAPAYVPLDLGQVATGREYWRCTGCRELVRVPAGVRRGDWQKSGCALHLAPVPVADVPAPVPAIDVPAPVPAPVPVGSTGCAAPAPVPVDVLAPSPPALHKEEVRGVLPVMNKQPQASGFVLLAVAAVGLAQWLAVYWRVPLACVLIVLLIVWAF